MMSAKAAGNRAGPNDPGPNGGNLHSCPNSAPNCGQQDLGAPMTSQDTGPSSHPQQHFSTRPVFYVPAPPPPPFLPFQWPMPFPYNPFGVSGYGMVIPPFAPPPYVDSPAYILPNPHIQPVDYRRLLHSQVPVPNTPYQNPNHTRRIQMPHTAPVRETVNSAVQTEPIQRHVDHYTDGSPQIRSDSGHGTTSDSPSSSSSSSRKQASVHDCSLTNGCARELQSHKTCKTGTDKTILTLHPVDVEVPSCVRMTVERQKCSKASDQANVLPYKNSHCNMWSVGSPDSIVPVCSSSQQEDEVIKERRVSFPDILMSWGSGTPQATSQKIPDKDFAQNENQLQFYKNVKEEEKSPTATNTSVELKNTDVGDDSVNVLCSPEFQMDSRNGPLCLEESERQSCLKDLLYGANVSNDQVNDELDLSEEPTDMISYQKLLSSYHLKVRMNESVWSVESLPPFIPRKELILQKKNVDSEMITKMSEETETQDVTKCDNSGDESNKEKAEFHGISSSSSVSVSKKLFNFTSPTRAEPKPDQRSPKGKKEKASLTPSPCDITPTAEEVDENRFSDPEATQSPNQEVTIENTDQEQSKCTPPVSVEGEVIHKMGTDMETISCGDERCGVMVEQRTDTVSPSKAQLVDCGIQCTSLLPYPQDEPRRSIFKYSDMKKDNGGKAEGFCSGQMQKSKRNGLRKYRGRGFRGPETQSPDLLLSPCWFMAASPLLLSSTSHLVAGLQQEGPDILYEPGPAQSFILLNRSFSFLLLLDGGHALGFLLKMPRHNFDCNRCYIIKMI
ncbi:uncharacterized protein isoform X2 [Takifugu rubripes]|nr:uncharacterized protein LOC105418115 isoform X2 [Takifugu rubripes]